MVSGMISDKMKYLMEHGNSAIRAMFEEGARLAALYGRENVFDFSLGNPNFPAPDAVRDAIIDIAVNDDPVALHGYMSNPGFPEVRRAVAGSLNERFGTSFDENNIIMTVGAGGALNTIFKVFLNPDDEVILISPYFVEYVNYISSWNGKVVPVPANPENFQPDTEAIRAAITPRTKAIIVNSPHNPTGVIYSEDSIKLLSAVLEEKSLEYGAPIYLISDEPYRELAFDGAEVPFLTKYYRNTIICYSFSKSLSLPGERIGYIVLPGDLEDQKLVFDATGSAMRMLGFVNAPSLMQKVIARCLNEQTDIGAYDSNRKLLYSELTSFGFDCVYPQGAFYMWMKTPCDDKEFVKAAVGHYILLTPGSAFGCPGYIRIAYCVAQKTIVNSLPGFKKLAEEYGL